MAGFNIAKSLLQVLQNPATMIRQTMAALIHDSESYYKVKKFIVSLVSIIVIMFAVLAFSGGAKFIFTRFMGVEGRVLDEAIIILRVFVFFPIAVSLRNFMQGIAIKSRMTFLTPIATIARVAFVVIIVTSIDKLMFLPPGVIAGVMFLGAIATEAIVMLLGVKFTIKDIPRMMDRLTFNKSQEYKREISYRMIITFFAPLVITSFIKSLAKPIIDSGLARTISPEVAISTYAVAWGLGVTIVSPLMMFHQVPLNFIESSKDKEPVKRFALYLGIVSSLILATLGFTPIGFYILKNLIGVSKEICNMSLDVLKVMTLLPMIVIVRQYYWGILMKKHMTKYVSNGKIVNLIALALTIFGVTLLRPGNPAIVGIIGKISSEAFESIYLYFVNRRKKINESDY
ncbi:MAG: hypothetical protein FH761_07185 [Firmicutes bacterium]|nr:hypothetical protein [Bacillota bacterium]